MADKFSRLTERPDPTLESFLDTLRGPGWNAADFGNGLLPADAPRGSYFDSLDGRVYGPDEQPERIRVVYLCEERRTHAKGSTAKVQADGKAERRARTPRRA
jgi:hypothetical protein